eukprot:scaffold5347_cov19-Tisochrysis_lutea.AAC.1
MRTPLRAKQRRGEGYIAVTAFLGDLAEAKGACDCSGHWKVYRKPMEMRQGFLLIRGLLDFYNFLHMWQTLWLDAPVSCRFVGP